MEDQTFWQEYDDVIGAAITLAITFAIAYIVDRFVLAHAGSVAAASPRPVSPRAAKTRLRVVRRLTFVVIVLIGCFLALNEFTKLDKLATGLLASSAVLGLVLGLAARQVLANPLAGLLLAFTQPIRIGDTISIDETTGRVADLTLSYTHRPRRRAADDHPERARGHIDGVQPLDRRSPGAARRGGLAAPAPTSRPRGQRSRRSRRPGSNSRRSRPRGSGSSFTAQVARTALGPGARRRRCASARTSCRSRGRPRPPPRRVI